MNEISLKMPPGEVRCGYVEDGAVFLPRKIQKYPSCGMRTLHYPKDHEKFKAAREKLKTEWKEDVRQFKTSPKDSSVPASKNRKNGKVLTAPPANPKLPKLLRVCKAISMKHSRRKGGFKCNNRIDRSCDMCDDFCTFACCTE